MKIQRILFLFLVLFGSGACTPSQIMVGETYFPPLTPVFSPTMDKNIQTPLALPTQGGNIQMTPYSPALQALIAKAKEDLAKRLSITVLEINVVEAAEVTWPDSSLGCPQEGMAYAQVLTPGYQILLEYRNNKYEYHSNKDTYVIYCMHPVPPDLGLPTQ
jgi:hypothetical protein